MNGRERPRPPAPAPTPAPATPAAGASPRENGWLPDYVYTGDRFESGLAFFADDRGRITRFSREPADLAAARRLSGQAAVPGLVNGHSRCLHRLLRGRTEQRSRAERDSLGLWHAAQTRLAGALTAADVYDTARMAFMEMLISGITCVGEFHSFHHQPDGSPSPEPNHLALQVLRAARDVGIRLALFRTACTREVPGCALESNHPRQRDASIDHYLREAEALRVSFDRHHSSDEAWTGIAPLTVDAVSTDELKAMAAYAHAQRLRLHVPLPQSPAAQEAFLAAHGRSPLTLLAEHGLFGKRFTAVHAPPLADAEIQLLAAARAGVCLCPTTARNLGTALAPADRLLAANVPFSLGTGSQIQIDLLEDARLIDYQLRQTRPLHPGLAPDVVVSLMQAATAAGARSLGATGGAIEAGRPADFLTVNLFDPSIAGAEPGALAANLLFSLERRAIREVWIGGRQVVTNGRHAAHSPIVARFVELQRRLWGSPGGAAPAAS